MKSFGVEVIADGSGKFSQSYLRFATRGEAEEFARDLASLWTLVSDWRVVESEDPANSRVVDGRKSVV